MIQGMVRGSARLVLAASFAVTAACAIIATQAVNPAAVDASSNSPLAATSLPASAEGYRHDHRGWYAWHGRYWHHRRWHAGHWGPYHRWHSGFWVYF